MDGPLQAATINVGNHVLLPNTSGQVVEILVAGGEMVISMDSYVTVGDGGPEMGGTDTRPTILLDKAGINGPGLVFDPARDNDVNGGSCVPGSECAIFGPGLFAYGGAVLPRPDEGETIPVPATGVLLRLLVDTTGVAPGVTIPLDATWPAGNPTGFVLRTSFVSGRSEIFPTIIPGSLIVVPEPSTLALAGFGALALVSVMRRRRR
jgi:hypothetical protein